MSRFLVLLGATVGLTVASASSVQAQPAGSLTFRGTCALYLIRPIPKCRPNWVPACLRQVQCTTGSGRLTTICRDWRCIPRFFPNRAGTR